MWQPIETAPKDGTTVLVFRMDCDVTPIVHAAFYNSESCWEEFGALTDQTKEDFIGWWSYTRSSVTQEKLDDHWTPTHWMPLPEPPALEGKDGD